MTATEVQALLTRLYWSGPAPAHTLRDQSQVLEHCHHQGFVQPCGAERWQLTAKGQRLIERIEP